MSGLKVMAIPGLTLPEINDLDLQRMHDAAGAGSELIVSHYRDAVESAADVEVILGLVSPELFAAAPNLKWVQSISSGVDAYMYPEFINSSVILTSEKGLVGEHLADHGFGLLLMLTRQLARARDLGADSWNHRPELRREEMELTGLCMGIIGYGGTGRAMAKRAAAFGMAVRAVDRDLVPGDHVVAEAEPTSALGDLLAWSDVLVVCAPLTAETRGLLDARAFGQLKEGAFLINVTRGEIMVEAALVEALKSSRLRGAGLDVAPTEPLPEDSELWRLPNVVMTPHTAGASQFRAARNMDRFVANLARFVKGEPLEGVIDKLLGY